MNNLLKILLAIFLPPVCAFIQVGFSLHFLINIVLTLLGGLPGIEQPSQKRFETLIAEQLETFDLSRPVYLEGESAKIGRVCGRSRNHSLSLSAE